MHTSRTLSRRRALSSIGALAIGVAVADRTYAAQIDATPAAAPVTYDDAAATTPDWRFSVLQMIDPYTGTLTRPKPVPEGERVVALEVVLENHSDQPMEYALSSVRLRDVDGVEYRAGSAVGEEPRLVAQNLPNGERTRGWVWFAIAGKAKPTSIVFIAPAPVLKIEL